MDTIAEQVLIGSLLGDGGVYLPKRYQNAFYAENKKITHLSYLEWKMDALSSFDGGIKIVTRFKEGHQTKLDWWLGNDSYQVAVLRTNVHPILTKLRGLWYPNGKKIVPEKEIQKLNELGLAVFYMDDGCYEVLGRYCMLSTKGFSLGEQKIIAAVFKENFGLKSRIRTDGKGYWLDLSVADTDKFLKIVEPHIHPCMIYKLGHIHPANDERLRRMRESYLERRRQRARGRYKNDPDYRAHRLKQCKEHRNKMRNDPVKWAKRLEYSREWKKEKSQDPVWRARWLENQRRWRSENAHNA